MNEYIDKLKILGLDPVESHLYLTLLKLKSASVILISRDSGIKRSTCYGILEKLVEKGVATEKTIQKTKYFSPVNLDITAEKLNKEYQEFIDIIPELRDLTENQTDEPKVEFFRGLENVKNLYLDTLSAEDEILGYVNFPSRHLELLYRFMYEEYIPRRVSKNIKYRGIYVRNDFAFYAKEVSKNQVKEIRFIPEDELEISHEINIYNDKISYIFVKGRSVYGVLIKDIDIIKTEKRIFEIIWKYSQQFDQSVPTDFNVDKFKRENLLRYLN